MGESIGMTLRTPDGTVHRMCRWTRVVPDFLNNIGLINKESCYIGDLLSSWYEMREDYNQHHKDRKFKYEMTPIYSTFHFLAPVDHGLILIDMANNYILNYQAFFDMGVISAESIIHDVLKKGDKLTDIGQVARRIFENDGEYSAAIRFQDFLNDGRILKAVNEKSGETIPLNGKKLDKIIELILSGESLNFPLDMSPFKIRSYEPYDPEEAIIMMMEIQNLGFKLDSKEKYFWNQWTKNHS
jgi:hypothetical protein